MTPADPTRSASSTLYTDGEYGARHPTWHLEDAPNKAQDLLPGLRAVAAAGGATTLRLADVGAGVGGVGVNLKRLAAAALPGVRVELTAFEISAACVERARELFPELEMRRKFFEAADGPFDAVILADVLEHLENPWELLRAARAAGSFLLVRQPLLDGFSTFRHDAYRAQRDTWGHIAYFNHRSFADMAAACGWRPLATSLLAPWELSGAGGRASALKRFAVRRWRSMASFLMSGFYLNGAFRADDPATAERRP